jgi:hypothetical protein
MSSMWAVPVYAVAIGAPLAVLYFHGSTHWYWHALAILAALAVGLVSPPVQVQGVTFDMICGFVFIFLMVWGIGGIVVFRPHHAKHA